MRLTIQSKTVPVSAAIHDWACDHFAKIIDKGLKITKIQVFLETIGKKGDQFSAAAKAVIRVPGKKDIVIKRWGSDLYQAIAETADRAGRLVRKRKERLQLATRGLSS